ncbi:MAG: hypothetical protein WCR21_10495 [Bacteroidota bacterium]
MPSLLLFFTLFFNSPHSLQQLRDLFPLIGLSETSNKQMMEQAENNKQLNVPIKKAYFASAKMASAKFKIFPLAKYQAFLEGKKLLEESVALDKQNPEIRFVRFVIQSNLPSFLFYSQNISEDKAFITKSLPVLKTTDPDLHQRIVNYFGKK